MRDVTPVHRARIARLRELHDERLVRVLRARLGRYDWDLAEVIAAATWRLAADREDQLRTTDTEAFPWLTELARSAQTTYFRKARSHATDADRTRAYALPAIGAAVRVEPPARTFGETPAPMGVAA